MKLFIKIFSWLGRRGSRAEKVAALVVLGFFAAVYLVIPSQISLVFAPPGSLIGYSPRLFPYVIAVLAIILSLGLLIKGFAGTPGVVEGGKGSRAVEPVRRAMLVVVVLAIYLFLFNLLGYVVSILLCYVVLMWYYGLSFRKEWKVAVPLVILLPLLIYYVFKMLLYVALPTGTIPRGIFNMLGFY